MGSGVTASAVALDGKPGQGAHRPRFVAETGQCLLHRLAERAQALARGFHADQRGERRLVLLRVLAGRLAEGGAVALDVEQVVAPLAGQAERVCDAVQVLARNRVDARRDRTQPPRPAPHRAGPARVRALAPLPPTGT